MPKSKAPDGTTGNGKTVTVALPDDLIKSLDEWADHEGTTRGEAMRWIIDQYFKKREETGLI